MPWPTSKEMFHRIHTTSLICGGETQRILAFQQRFLTFACKRPPSAPLTPYEIQGAFPGKAGIWLTKKLWQQGATRSAEPTAFGSRLIRLLSFLDSHPDEGDEILRAYSADIAFESHMDDTAFLFSFQMLSQETRDAIKPLMTEFYDSLLARGFDASVHNGRGPFTRHSLLAAFWQANDRLKVCPACDAARRVEQLTPTRATTDSLADDAALEADSGTEKVYTDLDHFLPAAQYPFLSVHPQNLVPICSLCNREVKVQADPIGNHKSAPLVSTYHPYYRPAIDYVDVAVGRDDLGRLKVVLTDSRSPDRRRLDTLNRILRLNTRWKGDLEQHYLDVVLDELKLIAQSRADSQEPMPDIEGFKTIVRRQRNMRDEAIGERPGYVLQRSYLDYSLSDQTELASLYRQFATAYQNTLKKPSHTASPPSTTPLAATTASPSATPQPTSPAQRREDALHAAARSESPSPPTRPSLS